jgi:hypothetical protein
MDYNTVMLKDLTERRLFQRFSQHPNLGSGRHEKTVTSYPAATFDAYLVRE